MGMFRRRSFDSIGNRESIEYKKNGGSLDFKRHRDLNEINRDPEGLGVIEAMNSLVANGVLTQEEARKKLEELGILEPISESESIKKLQEICNRRYSSNPVSEKKPSNESKSIAELIAASERATRDCEPASEGFKTDDVFPVATQINPEEADRVLREMDEFDKNLRKMLDEIVKE